MSDTPALPFMEAHVRPPDLARPDPRELIVLLMKDSAGAWWHVVGRDVIRRATVLETLLPMAPEAWRRLGTPAREAPDLLDEGRQLVASLLDRGLHRADAIDAQARAWLEKTK